MGLAKAIRCAADLGARDVSLLTPGSIPMTSDVLLDYVPMVLLTGPPLLPGRMKAANAVPITWKGPAASAGTAIANSSNHVGTVKPESTHATRGHEQRVTFTPATIGFPKAENAR